MLITGRANLLNRSLRTNTRSLMPALFSRFLMILLMTVASWIYGFVKHVFLNTDLERVVIFRVYAEKENRFRVEVSLPV